MLGAGGYITKSRGELHAMWNAGTVPARMIEIISPAGFEHCFREVADLAAAGPPALDQLAALAANYGLEFGDAPGYPTSSPATGSLTTGVHRVRPVCRKNDSGSWPSRRTRIMPTWAVAITSSAVWQQRLANSPPLTLAHSPSTGFNSGAYAGR